MEIDERMSRILAITDFYLSRFGRTQVGIFQLPTSDPNPSWFYISINTLMSALRRCNNLESGARLIDAVINNDLLPAVSVEFLRATMEGKEMKKVILDAEDGKFVHRIE